MKRVLVLLCLFSLLLAPISVAAPPAVGTWVDSPIAAGRDELFAYFSGLALDDANQPVILYNDADAAQVKMAMPGLVDWQITTVAYEAGYFCRLAYDGDGLLHGIYITATGNLRYGTYNGSWHFETVGVLGDGTYADLALDSAGHPYIAYINAMSGMLRCSWHDGAAWHHDDIAQVGITVTNFRELTIAIDGADVPHISSPYEPGGAVCSLIHATIGTQGWGYQVVDAIGERGKGSDILVDGAGVIHITYRDSDANDLRHAWFDTQWHTENLDGAGDTGYHSSMALDADGDLSVAYYDREGDRLRYAWHDGATWHKQTLTMIDQCRDGFTSLAFDGLGRPHMIAVEEEGSDRELNHLFFDAVLETPTPTASPTPTRTPTTAPTATPTVTAAPTATATLEMATIYLPLVMR